MTVAGGPYRHSLMSDVANVSSVRLSPGNRPPELNRSSLDASNWRPVMVTSPNKKARSRTTSSSNSTRCVPSIHGVAHEIGCSDANEDRIIAARERHCLDGAALTHELASQGAARQPTTDLRADSIPPATRVPPEARTLDEPLEGAPKVFTDRLTAGSDSVHNR
jgi:hypothetical protein